MTDTHRMLLVFGIVVFVLLMLAIFRPWGDTPKEKTQVVVTPTVTDADAEKLGEIEREHSEVRQRLAVERAEADKALVVHLEADTQKVTDDVDETNEYLRQVGKNQRNDP